MSFADGLLHERQAADAKTRVKLNDLISRIEKLYGNQMPGDIGAIEGKQYTISAKEREQIIGYLKTYSNGGQLR